jgi:hypothetical protein
LVHPMILYLAYHIVDREIAETPLLSIIIYLISLTSSTLFVFEVKVA